MTLDIDQIKTQLKQLAELAQSGDLSEALYQEARIKLERQLLDLVLNAAPAAAASSPASAATPVAQAAKAVTEPQANSAASPKMLMGMAAFVLVVGAVGYLTLGNRAALDVGPGASAGTASGEAANGSHALGTDQIAGMAESLAAKLKKDPNNAEGWAMLARSYAVLGRFDEAVPAYKRVLELRTDDAQVYADYADALAVTQDRKLDGEPAKLIAKSLSIDPNNFKALSLSGTMAFEKQDFKKAADLWERALKTAPADNPELSKQIRTALDDARKQAGLPPLPPMVQAAPVAQQTEATAPLVAANPNAVVSGTVTLSKSLAGKASPEDTVFIFAKAANGPKMPLAILRKQVKDLPATFSLSDELAMSPQMKLSGFSELVVGARVSKSGQAMPTPGDLQGTTGTVKLGAKDLKIEISETVK